MFVKSVYLTDCITTSNRLFKTTTVTTTISSINSTFVITRLPSTRATATHISISFFLLGRLFLPGRASFYVFPRTLSEVTSGFSCEVVGRFFFCKKETCHYSFTVATLLRCWDSCCQSLQSLLIFMKYIVQYLRIECVLKRMMQDLMNYAKCSVLHHMVQWGWVVLFYLKWS